MWWWSCFQLLRAEGRARRLVCVSPAVSTSSQTPNTHAVVDAITQDPASGVTVTTADGATFTAPHAIITLPLGVLKETAGAAAAATSSGPAGAAQLAAVGAVAFDPPLPAGKARAVAEMGVGVLDKLVLVWDEPWWPRNADFVTRELVDCSGKW